MSNAVVDSASPANDNEAVEESKGRRMVQMSLSPDLYDFVAEVARREERAVANLAKIALMRYLREIGYPPPEDR